MTETRELAIRIPRKCIQSETDDFIVAVFPDADAFLRGVMMAMTCEEPGKAVMMKVVQ